MANICDLCGRKTYAGRQHTHHAGVAGGQWKKRAPITLRSFKPNLHWITLPLNGNKTRIKACAKCIKRVRFDLKKSALKLLSA